MKAKWRKIPKDKHGFFDEESDLYDKLTIIITEKLDEYVTLHYIDEENWHDTLPDLNRQRFAYYIEVEPFKYELP